jgi:hypothetical protein
MTDEGRRIDARGLCERWNAALIGNVCNMGNPGVECQEIEH